VEGWNVGSRDETVAFWVAEVERFLKKGILERRRDSCCGAVVGLACFVMAVDC
jgi:hypothetical protein